MSLVSDFKVDDNGVNNHVYDLNSFISNLVCDIFQGYFIISTPLNLAKSKV